MNPANYSAFDVTDLLEDDFFVQWVTSPDEKSNAFWKNFLAEYPHKKTTVDAAAATILQYRKQDFVGNEAQQEKVWERISVSVQQIETTKKKAIFSIPVWARVAAAVTIIVGIGLLFRVMNGEKLITITTTAGQLKTITLPDHSKVTLNGNSSLSYQSGWSDDVPREVWIKGEGYFDVQHINKDTLHIQPAERFVVHCGDVNIEVLGTSFNVKNRGGKTNVALLTGKIKIDNVVSNNKANAQVLLSPGDYVEYSGKELLVSKKLAKPAQLVSWTSDEISFSNPTLKEIAETLENRFGYTISTADASLLTQKIEGEITVTNVADLLDVVTTTLNIKIEQSANKHITISK